MLNKNVYFEGWGIGGLCGLGVWGIATSPKCSVVQARLYLNAALSKCGVVVALTLSLVLTLASCKNRNVVLT